MQTARNLSQSAFADRMKADVIFQKDVAGMVRCDLFLDSCSHHPYLAEQPPVWFSEQRQEHSHRWDGQGVVPY